MGTCEDCHWEETKGKQDTSSDTQQTTRKLLPMMPLDDQNENRVEFVAVGSQEEVRSMLVYSPNS